MISWFLVFVIELFWFAFIIQLVPLHHGGTLIVMPKSLLEVWREELEKRLSDADVMVWYGPHKVGLY
jgi:SNF2 family DNA or RNA helicase